MAGCWKAAVLQLLALCLNATCCEGAPSSGRAVAEKTPHPCKAKYEDKDIDEWVAKHLSGAKGGHETPNLLILLGGSAAGKGTFIQKWKEANAASAVRGDIKDFVFHGLDEYLPYIPEYQKTIADTSYIYKDAADACYGGAAIPAAKKATEELIKRKMDVIYEETGKSLDRIKKRVLPPFIKAGYRITTVLIHNKAETAMERAAGRFQSTGRYAPDDYIKGTFQNNLQTFLEMKHIKECEEFVYCDNSGDQMHCWMDGHEVGHGKAHLPLIKGEGLVPEDLLRSGRPTYIKEAAQDEL